jgi:penicillin-binding protein 1C
MFRRVLYNFLVFLGICLLVAVTLRLIPHPPLSYGLMFSTEYYDRNDKLLRLTLSKDETYKLWTNIEDVSPYVINGVLLHEDKYFYYHP